MARAAFQPAVHHDRHTSRSAGISGRWLGRQDPHLRTSPFRQVTEFQRIHGNANDEWLHSLASLTGIILTWQIFRPQGRSALHW
jgi:hypothetical protein